MAGLKDIKLSDGYKSLLRIDDNNNGIDTSLDHVTDGEGTQAALLISDDNIAVRPNNDDTTTLLHVRAKGGGSLLAVDSTNSVVKAGVGQFNVLNQYAYFGIDNSGSANFADDTHYAIPFSNMPILASVADVDFGTGTDPDDTFTTANTDTQYASQIVPMMWFVPDNISIDSVTSIEGADLATGDTTRMHLKSFTLNSGSTSCLTSGALLAHNSDVTNDGNEQAYRSTWTVDSASVSANKVILAFFRQDSENSDYSINITVKYHLV